MIQPNIYSLKYLNKEEALKDLKGKNVIDRNFIPLRLFIVVYFILRN
jgi:hypothetical protein